MITLVLVIISLGVCICSAFVLFLVDCPTRQAVILDLPESPEGYTSSFLTHLLQTSVNFPKDVCIKSVSLQQLKGGLHFRVWKATLTYGGNQCPLNSPDTVIIKQLNGESAFGARHKIALILKNFFPNAHFGAHIENLYYRLQSYRSEIHFYESIAKDLKLPTPTCYFKYENYYRFQFLLILKDLTYMENGEPNGFSFYHAKLILRNIAALHAKYWRSQLLKNEKRLWVFGSYWLGNKEKTNYQEFSVALQAVFNNFPTLVNHFPQARAFASQIESSIPILEKCQYLKDPLTLIHGDYKITNIFIDVDKSSQKSSSRKHDEYGRHSFNNNFGNEKVFTIDWQWMGKGSSATDIAYFMYTSLALNQSSFLDDQPSENYPQYNAIELELLEFYHKELVIQGVNDFAFDEFEKVYALNVVLFLIFCVKEKWSNMNMNDMESFNRDRSDGLHLRKPKHMLQLLKRCQILLDYVDLKSIEKNARKQ